MVRPGLRVLLQLLLVFLMGHSAPAAIPGPREPWNGGRIPLDPQSGEWKTVDAFPEVGPTWSVSLAAFPGETNRILLVGMGGLCLEVTNFAAPVLRVFLDITDRTWLEIESGLLGLALHPGFRTNGHVFAYYSWRTGGMEGARYHNRLSRFTAPPGGGGIPDPASETVLFSQPDASPHHNAGCIAFGPDGHLYLSVGDGSVYEDRVTQRVDRGFYGGILRLDVDRLPGNPPPNPGFGSDPAAFSVPADNPFIGRTEYSVGSRVVWSGVPAGEIRTEFFAIGMRNPWQFSFDPLTGDLWANDVGNGAREEVNRVVAGGNYGWPWREGALDVVDPPVPGTIDPVYEYTHASGRVAITGSRFQRGPALPDLDGSYLFCDWTGDIASLRPDGTNPPTVRWIASEPNTVAFGTDPRDGGLLLTPSHDGKVKRLVREESPGDPWPALLSETGVFSNIANRVPAAGVVPYEINAQFWSDHALKRRWFALPGVESRIGFKRDEPWTFPVGTIWVKHFDRPYVRPAEYLIPMETRILVMTTNGIRGASYRWNDAGTDAELVPAAGGNASYFYWNPTNLLTQQWRFPSRTECLSCHTPAVGGPAGFNTGQLNRSISDGTNLVSQLDALAAAGYFDTPPVHTGLMPALVDPADATAPLEKRVRSYLDANCSSCHRPGGLTRVPWDARLQTPLDRMGLLDVLESAPVGTNATALVSPGRLQGSALFLRVSEMGAFHMPPLGGFELNASAISMLAEWITNALPARRGYADWAAGVFGGASSDLAAMTADPDGDGLDNFAEYLLRESPYDATIRWRPMIERTPGDGLRLLFPRIAGRKHEAVWTDTPLDVSSWRRLESSKNDPRPAESDGVAVLPLPPADARFYRVRVTID